MKTIFIALMMFVSISRLSAQTDDVFSSYSKERDTIFAVIPVPMFSMGIFGGVSFVSPDKINGQIEYNNSTYNTEEYPISRPGQYGIWFAYRPKNLPTFLSLRAEWLSTTRTYPFTANITTNNPNSVTPVASSTQYRYTVYPFSIGTGSVLFKTIAKAEIGFIYALAFISQETDVPGYSHSKTTYEGEGYGFRLNLQQVIPIERTVGMTVDIGYRYLIIDEFRDAKGVLIKNTDMDYSGINLSAGLSYGF